MKEKIKGAFAGFFFASFDCENMLKDYLSDRQRLS